MPGVFAPRRSSVKRAPVLNNAAAPTTPLILSTVGAWDGNNKDPAVSLSNSDLTASWSGTTGAVAATDTKAYGSGKYYFEIVVGGSAPSTPLIGVLQKASGLVGSPWASGSMGVLYDAAGNAYDADGAIGSVTPWAFGDVLRFAVDLTTGTFWFGVNGNILWNANPSADPATGVGGYQWGTNSGSPFIIYASAGGSGSATLQMSTHYAAPSGFSPWYAPPVYWSVSDKDPNLAVSSFRTLSNTTGGWYMGRASLSRSDRRYFELKYDDPVGSNDIIAGVANASATTSNFVGSDANGIGLWRNGSVVFENGSGQSPISGAAASAFNPGDIIGFDVDGTNQQICFNVNGGAFSGWYSIPFAGPYFPAASFSGQGDVLASWVSTDLANAPPSGSQAWYTATVANDNAIGSATLGPMTSVGTATVLVSAAGAATLGSLTSVGAAAALISASGNAALGALTSVGAASDAAAASASSTLGSLTSVGTAVVAVAATGAVTLASLTSVGTATVKAAASSSSTLDGLTSVGTATTGTAPSPISAAGSATLDPMTSVGTAAVPLKGSGNATLAGLTSSGSAAARDQSSGAGVLDQLTSVGSAVARVSASGAATLAAMTSVAGGQVRISAAGAATLDGMTSAGSVAVPDQAIGGGLLGLLTSNGSARISIAASGDATLAPMTSIGTAVHFLGQRNEPAALLI